MLQLLSLLWMSRKLFLKTLVTSKVTPAASFDLGSQVILPNSWMRWGGGGGTDGHSLATEVCTGAFPVSHELDHIKKFSKSELSVRRVVFLGRISWLDGVPLAPLCYCQVMCGTL